MKLLFVAAVCFAVSVTADNATAETLRLFNVSDKAITFSIVVGERIGHRRLEPRCWTDVDIQDDDDERVLIVRDAGNSADEILATPSRVRETIVFHAGSVAGKLLVAFFRQPQEEKYGLDLFAIGRGTLVPVPADADAASRLGALQEKFHAESRLGIKRVEFASRDI